MASYSTQSAHNKGAHDLLEGSAPKYIDWQITVLFYAALHAVNFYFELQGIPAPRYHRERLSLIRQHLPAISDEYKNLQFLSEQARYCGREEVDATSTESARRSYSAIMRHLA